MNEIVHETFFTIGCQTFHSLYLRPEFLEKALTEAGFTDLTLEQQPLDMMDSSLSDAKEIFFIKATKSPST